MKKSPICVALLLCLCAGSSAQFIYNPSDTPATGYYCLQPFYFYSSSRFQFIIDKTIMGGKPCVITDIAFTGFWKTTFAVSDFQMRMGHTTHKNFSGAGTTKFDDMLGSAPTEVYKRGAIRWLCNCQAWSDIGLTSPFVYNGIDNICVEIRYNHTGSSKTLILTDSSIARAFTDSGQSADPFNATNWYTPIPAEMAGPKHRLTIKPASFTCYASAKQSINTSSAISLLSGPATDFFQIAASMGNKTKLDLGKCSVYLDPDGVLFYSLLSGPPYFDGYRGTLVAGAGKGKFLAPDIPALIGLSVYHAAVAFDQGGVTACTNTVATELVASAAAAQPLPGDIVFGAGSSSATVGHVGYIDVTNGKIATLAPNVGTSFYNFVQVAENNTDVIGLLSGTTDFLHRITPTGVVTTIANLGSWGDANGIDLGQDGNWYLSSSSSSFHEVRMVTPIGVVTTFVATPSDLNGLAWDQDSDRLMLAIRVAGTLIWADNKGVITGTLATGLPALSGVDQSPATGNFLTSDLSVYCRVISPVGTTLQTFSGAYGQCVKGHDPTSQVYVGDSHGKISVHDQFTGAAIKTYGPYSGYLFTGIDIYGSRVVSGSGSAKSPSVYTVNFNFPGQGNKYYVGALAFLQRPGLRITPTQTINLAPDSLFFASLAGVLVTNFQGTLNASGSATGRITIPPGIPPGITIYCSALAVAGSRLITGNTIGITTR